MSRHAAVGDARRAGGFADARSLTLAISGTWRGSYGTAPCPVCQPERRSDQTALTLAHGRVGLLLHCHKGGCAFATVLAAAGIERRATSAPDPARLARLAAEARNVAQKAARRALAIWREAAPICGTAGERYLRARGISCELPQTLRYHPACWHPSGQRLPAIIALVEGLSHSGVHRIFIRADGSGKAGVTPTKAMLGQTRGGAVRLGAAEGPLVVAEGVETGLAVQCLIRSQSRVWAALSASGMRALMLPKVADRLVVAPDGDDSGRSAARHLADRARRAGWQVHMLDPGDGLDWNDRLRAQVQS